MMYPFPILIEASAKFWIWSNQCPLLISIDLHYGSIQYILGYMFLPCQQPNTFSHVFIMFIAINWQEIKFQSGQSRSAKKSQFNIQPGWHTDYLRRGTIDSLVPKPVSKDFQRVGGRQNKLKADQPRRQDYPPKPPWLQTHREIHWTGGNHSGCTVSKRLY